MGYPLRVPRFYEETPILHGYHGKRDFTPIKMLKRTGYNPDIHHRRSIRLKEYDYSQAGAYFITICCQNRVHRFGTIEAGEMKLNEFGEIAHNEWVKLQERFENFELDVFQIMPNHMHGIIVLTENMRMETTDEAASTTHTKVNIDPEKALPKNKTIGDIVGAYKSLVAMACLGIYKMKNEQMGKFWQRNYYEHIIRNEESYRAISNYIINNPLNWKDDEYFIGV